MPRILVPPEVLIRVSEEAARAAEELETTKNRLDQQITYMMSSWEGTTRSRFFEDFQYAHGEMNKTIEHLRIIGQELKAIAFRFISADMHEDLMIAAAAASGANEPKTFWDHAGDFWQGLQTGAKSVANSVKDTATSLVEDPLDTAKDMAYNMTIGTIEEAAETVVWGGKMIFDADTQDKFAADVEASGGAFNFAGQQAAMAIAGLTTRRFGVKTHPNLKNDSGGDGGKGDEVKVKPNYLETVNKFEDHIRNKTLEHGQFFDKNGNSIGETVVGTEKSINISMHKDIAKDKVFTHNHPTNGPFSLEDIATAVDFNMSEIRAVSPNGTNLSMNRGTDGWKVNAEELGNIFANAQKELRNDPIAKEYFRTGNKDAVWDMLFDRVAEKIGGEYKVHRK